MSAEKKHQIASIMVTTAIVFFTCSHSQVLASENLSTAVKKGAKQHAQTTGQGIWKSATPPRPIDSEFDGHDPIGLASGAKIKTDCSINWVNPDSSKRYCFASATSLVYFLRWPKRNSNRAKVAWQKVDASHPSLSTSSDH